MGKFEKYTTYKDSGVEWLGEIPEHWDVKKLKFVLKINNGQDYKNVISDEGYPVIGSGGQFAFSNQYLYDGEVLLLGRKGTIDKPLYFKGKFWTVDTMFYGVSKQNNNTKFLYYSSLYIPFQFYSTSTALPSMTQFDLNNHKISLPSNEEQTKIASFLDEKTAQIDSVISQKEKLIELLKEYKEITINEAVTKGLNKDVEFKDSGVEWIGEIPKHWEVERLGSNFMERKEKVSDKDFKPLSVTKNGVVPQLDNAAKTNDGDNRKLVKTGDFIINSRSDRKGSSGLSKLDGSVSLINIVLKPLTINPKFSHILLKSNGFIEEFYRNGHGIVADLWTTRFWDMKSIMLALPPKDEQIKIVEYIETQTTKIDKAIEIQQNYITKLKEYKASLIDSAVTGKTRVRL